MFSRLGGTARGTTVDYTSQSFFGKTSVLVDVESREHQNVDLTQFVDQVITLNLYWTASCDTCRDMKELLMTVAPTKQTNPALQMASCLGAKDGFMHYLSKVSTKLCNPGS